MLSNHEVGVVCLCALCDSYFLIVLTQVDYKRYRGKEGTRALEHEYEKMQTKLEKETYSLLRCPTCMEVTTSLKYSDWLSSDMPAHLSPCKYVSFDPSEPPPLYVDESQGGKPKWTLAQGVGPKTLEMDHSRSNRIYKPSLRGIVGEQPSRQEKDTHTATKKKRPSTLDPFKADADANETAQLLLDKLTLIHSAISFSAGSGEDEAALRSFYGYLFSQSPVFRCSEWDEVKAAADAAIVHGKVMGLREVQLDPSPPGGGGSVYHDENGQESHKRKPDAFDVCCDW